MTKYEAMFLLDSGYAAAHWDDSIKELINIMQRHGAEIIRLVKWDDRKLAYEIGHHKRGTYILAYFKAPGEAIGKINRDVELSENVVRVLVLKHEKTTEEMMLRQPIPSGEPNIIGETLPPLPPPTPAVAPVAAGDAAAADAAIADIGAIEDLNA